MIMMMKNYCATTKKKLNCENKYLREHSLNVKQQTQGDKGISAKANKLSLALLLSLISVDLKLIIIIRC